MRPWNTEMGSPSSFRKGFFTGERVVALIGDTPVTSEGRLFNASGALLLKLGDLADHAPHSLGGDRWALETWEARTLLILDARRGRLVTTYPLRPTVPEELDASNAMVDSVALRADGGVTLLFANHMAGAVAIFAADPSAPPRLFHPPTCAAPR